MAGGNQTRRRLLETAERLFAEQGIAQVSDRRLAEAAGSSNHSAVGYHFGGRDGLLIALLADHVHDQEEERARLFDRSDSVLGDVRALTLPMTTSLDRLPRPSWRARFMAQAQHDPTCQRLVRDTVPAVGKSIMDSLARRLSDQGLEPAVAKGRIRLMVRMIATACAEVEEQAAETGKDPRWPAVGMFLADALAGMLTAPVSDPAVPG